jgi:excisionase family DNA binding protein
MIGNFLTVRDVSKMLGVTPLTLRNWDKAGKLVAVRHPMSNYRIYKRDDIEKFVHELETGGMPLKSKPRRVRMKERKLTVRSVKD